MFVMMNLVEVNTYSEVLQQHVSFSVLLPQADGDVQRNINRLWPTLYLFHGLYDDHTAWLRWTNLEMKAWDFPAAIVMPAAMRGFCTDMKYGPKHFTFLAEELPEICESMFHLSSAREDRFAAGLSMGGYGAFKLGLLYPERFAAVASLSGALDSVCVTKPIDEFIKAVPDFRLIFGEPDKAIGGPDDLFHDAEMLIAKGTPKPKFFQWCGYSDSLYAENKIFAEKYGKALQIDYRESEGSHDWKCWDEHIREVLDWLPIQNRKL